MPLKIRNKLFVAFLSLIIVILTVSGIVGYYNQQSSDEAVKKVQAISEEVIATANLGHALEHSTMPANDYLITGNRRYVDEFKKVSAEMEERLSETKKLLDHIHTLDLPAVENESIWLKEIETAWQNIKEISLRIFEIPDPIGNRDGAKLMEEIDYRWARHATDLIHKWHEVDAEEYGAAVGKAERTKRLSWSIMSASGVLLLVLGAGFAVFYSRLFVRPIETIHNGADAIAKGDFKTRLDIRTGDEIQQLANAMNEMAAQLDSFTSNLQGMVEERTAELRESEERYRGIFEKTPNAMVVFDAETLHFENVNSAATDLYGYTEEEFLSLTPVDVSAEVEKTRKSVQNGLAEESAHVPVRYHKKKDGTVFPIEIFMGTFLSGGRRKGFAVVVDLTEIKKAEEKLKYERDKLIKIFEAMEDGVYIVNQNYDIEYINPFLEREYGPWKGIKCYTYFHDRTEICPWCPNQRVWAGETVRWEWYSFKNGKTYDLIDTPLKNPDGSVWKLEIFRDITERTKAEKALKESEQRLQLIMGNMRDTVFFYDMDRRLQFVTPAFEELTGYTVEELYEKNFINYIHPENGDRMMELWEGLFQGRAFSGMEFRIVTKDGRTKWCSSSWGPVLDEERRQVGVQGRELDITERKEAEEAVLHKVNELEQFRKVTIKRELRMEELQRKVEEMERKFKI